MIRYASRVRRRLADRCAACCSQASNAHLESSSPHLVCLCRLSKTPTSPAPHRSRAWPPTAIFGGPRRLGAVVCLICCQACKSRAWLPYLTAFAGRFRWYRVWPLPKKHACRPSRKRPGNAGEGGLDRGWVVMGHEDALKWMDTRQLCSITRFASCKRDCYRHSCRTYCHLCLMYLLSPSFFPSPQGLGGEGGIFGGHLPVVRHWGEGDGAMPTHPRGLGTCEPNLTLNTINFCLLPSHSSQAPQ